MKSSKCDCDCDCDCGEADVGSWVSRGAPSTVTGPWGADSCNRAAVLGEEAFLALPAGLTFVLVDLSHLLVETRPVVNWEGRSEDGKQHVVGGVVS
jgi:hypothetical protein